MPDIVNAGAMFLVAGLCVVAVVGAVDQIRDDARPASSTFDPDATVASEAEPPDVPDVRTPMPEKQGADDGRGDKHGDGERGRGHEDDRRGDKDDGDDDGDDGDDEDDD